MQGVRCGDAGSTLCSFRTRTPASVVLTFLAGRCSECRTLALVARAGGLRQALPAFNPSTCGQKELIHGLSRIPRFEILRFISLLIRFNQDLPISKDIQTPAQRASGFAGKKEVIRTLQFPGCGPAQSHPAQDPSTSPASTPTSLTSWEVSMFTLSVGDIHPLLCFLVVSLL